MPKGTNTMLAVTRINHMNTCLSPERFSRKFQVEWARAEAKTKTKANAVMGVSISPDLRSQNCLNWGLAPLIRGWLSRDYSDLSN